MQLAENPLMRPTESGAYISPLGPTGNSFLDINDVGFASQVLAPVDEASRSGIWPFIVNSWERVAKFTRLIDDAPSQVAEQPLRNDFAQVFVIGRTVVDFHLESFNVNGDTFIGNLRFDDGGVASIQGRNLEQINALAAEWKRFVLDRTAGHLANDLSRTIRPVFKALSQFGPGAIDLRDLPVEKVNGVHLAVVLRATSSMRSQTPGWASALSIAREAIQRDKIDEVALAGLL